MSKQRFKIIPAVYLILVGNEKVLLSRRYNTGYEDGNYSLVAGHVDAGESMTDCIIREAREEAGIELDLKDVSIVHMMHRVNLERVCIFACATNWGGNISIMEPDKCDDLSWFALDDLPENTIPYIRKAIECFRNNIFYSEEK